MHEVNLDPISALLKTDATVFWSDYGSKAITESWTVRLNKQIKQLDQVKQFQNLNIATGRESLIVDVDLDCEETQKLADSFYLKLIASLVEKAHQERIGYSKSWI